MPVAHRNDMTGNTVHTMAGEHESLFRPRANLVTSVGLRPNNVQVPSLTLSGTRQVERA